MRVGVDTGGTFTDLVVLDGGRARVLKVFSTPQDAARAIIEGVHRLAGSAREPLTLEIIHGTTVGTNSVLERKGARVALVTTGGFEDLLEIGRQARPRLYDLNAQREPPLVLRAFRFGVKERTVVGGKVLLRPAASELRRLSKQVRRVRPDSLALCFLFSFANPSNERAVARALESLRIPICVSHQILPEFREYERLSTVVINAYLAPRMGAYLSNLEQEVGRGAYGLRARQETPLGARTRNAKVLPRQSIGGRVFVMQSNGGITTAARAAAEPVRTILSGPAGGVVAAAWLARQLGIHQTISFDMGGTSTDVCLLEGQPRTTNETTLRGLPVAVPVLDVHSVGAGGGSLARLDAGGALRVGPESAGANPGPLCYGRGGRQPTVTDAHLLLGRLDLECFLGGEFRLDFRAAEQGFWEFLRAQGQRSPFRDPRELAGGIVAVANANMEKALRVISVERGHDPRDFALICFGGAGGLHAADLARSLRLPRAIVPPNPGAFSALGILVSDIIKDVTRSVLLAVPAGGSEAAPEMRELLRNLERRFRQLERAARAELRQEGFAPERAGVERRLDMRYAGQSYELPVPFTPGFRALFHREHGKVYGYAHPSRALEIVNLRMRLVIRTPKPQMPKHARGAVSPAAAVAKKKEVWFEGRRHATPVYDRERLRAGMHLSGPAVIVEYSSTTVVPPDFACRVDEYLNLVLSQR